MTTYTDRQKACIQALQDALLVHHVGNLGEVAAAKILAYLESTSPITGFSEPDGGAGLSKAALSPKMKAAGFKRRDQVELGTAEVPCSVNRSEAAGTLTDGTPIAIVREVYEKFAADDPKRPPSYTEGALDALDIVEQRIADTSQPAAPSTAAQGATLTAEIIEKMIREAIPGSEEWPATICGVAMRIAKSLAAAKPVSVDAVDAETLRKIIQSGRNALPKHKGGNGENMVYLTPEMYKALEQAARASETPPTESTTL
jgi:hypothetical protein